MDLVEKQKRIMIQKKDSTKDEQEEQIQPKTNTSEPSKTQKTNDKQQTLTSQERPKIVNYPEFSDATDNDKEKLIMDASKAIKTISQNSERGKREKENLEKIISKGISINSGDYNTIVSVVRNEDISKKYKESNNKKNEQPKNKTDIQMDDEEASIKCKHIIREIKTYDSTNHVLTKDEMQKINEIDKKATNKKCTENDLNMVQKINDDMKKRTPDTSRNANIFNYSNTEEPNSYCNRTIKEIETEPGEGAKLTNDEKKQIDEIKDRLKNKKCTENDVKILDRISDEQDKRRQSLLKNDKTKPEDKVEEQQDESSNKNNEVNKKQEQVKTKPSNNETSKKEQQESSKSVDKESPEQIQPKNNNTTKEETKKYNGHAHDEIAPLQGEYKAKIYGNVHEISSPFIGNELTSEEKEIAKKLYDKAKNKTLTYGDVDQIEKLYKKYRDNTSSSFSCSKKLSTLLTDPDFTQHLTHEEKIKLEEIDNRAKNKTTILSDNTYVRNLFNTTYNKLSSDVKKQRREKNKSDKKNKSTKTSKNETDQSKDSQVESDESKTQDDTSNKKNKCADFKNQPSDVKSLVKDAHILMSTVKDFVKTYFKIRIKSGGYDFYLLDEKQGEEILRHVGLYEQGSFIGRLDAGNKKYEAAINDVINYSEYVLKFKDKYSSKEFYKAKGQESKYDDDDYESEDEDVEEVYEEIEEKLKKVKKQLPALKNVMFESSYDLINDILTIFENSF